MKKLIIIFAAMVMMAAFTTKVMAQKSTMAFTSTAPNDARAEVLSSIGLTAVNPLEFGGLSSGASGTVILTPLGIRTATGGVTLLATNITPTAASYTMTGAMNTLYFITLPTTPQIITRVGNSATMSVQTFTCSYPTLSHLIDVSGTDAFTVGATLVVGASQLSGTYTGSFDVTVAY